MAHNRREFIKWLIEGAAALAVEPMPIMPSGKAMSVPTAPAIPVEALSELVIDLGDTFDALGSGVFRGSSRLAGEVKGGMETHAKLHRSGMAKHLESLTPTQLGEMLLTRVKNSGKRLPGWVGSDEEAVSYAARELESGFKYARMSEDELFQLGMKRAALDYRQGNLPDGRDSAEYARVHDIRPDVPEKPSVGRSDLDTDPHQQLEELLARPEVIVRKMDNKLHIGCLSKEIMGSISTILKSEEMGKIGGVGDTMLIVENPTHLLTSIARPHIPEYRISKTPDAPKARGI